MNKLIYTATFLFWALIVSAQEPVFKNFTVNNGLASTTVYHCFQDSKGFMWFSTETGVSRFDGITFETFTIEDGLSGNEVFKSYEDKSGKIWFATYNGKLSYYYRNAVFNETNDTLLKALSFSYFVKDIFQDKKGRLWFSSAKEGIKCLSINGTIKTYSDKGGTFNNIDHFEQTENGVIAVGDKKELYFKETAFVKKEENPCKIIRSIRTHKKLQAFRLCDDDFYVSVNEKQKKLTPFASGFISEIAITFLLEQNSLWVGTRGDGLLYFQKFADQNKVHHYLKGKTIAHIYRDNDENLWVSTLDNGIYFLPYNSFYSITTDHGLSTSFVTTLIHGENGKIYAGTSDGFINTINTHGKVLNKINLTEGNNQYNKVRKLIYDNHKVWAATDNGLYVIDSAGKVLFHNEDVGPCKTLQKATEAFYLGTSNGLYSVKAQNPLDAKRIWPNKVVAIQQKPDESLLLGTLEGLKIFKNDKTYDFVNDDRVLGRRITSIMLLSEHKKLIGTYGHGLTVMDHDDRVIQFTTGDGLISNFIQNIYIENEFTIWLCTNKGISKIQLDKSLTKIKSVDNFTTSDGLISNDTKDLIVVGGKAFVATSKGISIFPNDSSIPKESPPRVYIKSMMVNAEHYLLDSMQVFNHDQDHVIINFTGIAFRSMENIRFKYLLISPNNEQPEWKYTNATTVHYPSLKPGEYTFKVVAITKDGTESEVPATIYFRISPHFTQTWWFAVLTMVFSAGFIFYLVWARWNRMKVKNSFEKKLLELEHKALSAQMNPHFIFNTISSIQQFISSKDEKSANRYLARFAKLMRRILDSAKKPYISIQQEKELLETYLELESLRFDNKIHYSIKIDERIEEETTNIPTMLIQPIVENAILHGLSPKVAVADKVHVTVEISDKEEYCLCTVTDDGIGREQAKKINENRTVGHESTALNNIKERILMLSNNQIKEPITFEDLQNGTVVTIKIPYL